MHSQKSSLTKPQPQLHPLAAQLLVLHQDLQELVDNWVLTPMEADQLQDLRLMAPMEADLVIVPEELYPLVNKISLWEIRSPSQYSH